jgi:uncharacterized Zn-binding protein involved in type VI secretion
MDRKGTALMMGLLALALLLPTVAGQGGTHTGPSLNVVYPPDGLVTKATTMTVNGTTDGTSVKVNGLSASRNGKNFSLQISLIEGTNTILIETFDAYGNITDKAITVTKDTVPPVISVTRPLFPLLTNKHTVHIEGVIEKGCKVSVDGRPGTVTDDTFAADASLGNNTTTLLLKATDPAGNERAFSLPVRFYDKLNMSITTRFDHDYKLNATESKELIETYYNRIYINGKTDPGANATVNGNPIKVLADGSFETFVELKLGKNNITITVTDGAGNNVTGHLNVKRYYWEPFTVPVELAGSLLILGLAVGTIGGHYHGRHKERKVQAEAKRKAQAEAAKAARPKAQGTPKPEHAAPPKPAPKGPRPD